MKTYSITVEDDGPSYADVRNPSVLIMQMSLVCDEEHAKFIVESLKSKYRHPMIVRAYEQNFASKEVF